jgi:asparagine synthase (glutamine-hydrolysing)
MPDSVLVFLAYKKWGPSSAEYLLGDFAAAIWDNEEGKLFCLRDHIGVKPFFYFQRGHIFAFASDIPALLSLPEVPDILDEDKILDYLESDNAYPKDTLQKYIYRLSHSHYLEITKTRSRITQYWFPEHINTLHLPSEKAYAAQLRELLQQAVACRLRTDYAVGAHISGGLDSSSIAIIAHRLLSSENKALHAFAWQPNPESEQAEHDPSVDRINLIATREGISVTYLPWYINSTRGSQIDASLRSMQAIYMEESVQKQAQKKSIRLFLSGWGGDEGVSFNGRGNYIHQWRAGQWKALLYNLKGHRSSLWQLKTWLKNIPVNFWRKVIRELWVPTQLKQKLGVPGYILPTERFMRPQLRRGKSKYTRIDLHKNLQTSPDAQIQLFYYGHLAHRMESWAWSGAEYNMTYAYPLTDKRLLSFAYSLPPELFKKNSWNRYIYRMAAAPYFPEGFTWDKYGYVKAENLWRRQRISADLQLKHFQDVPMEELEQNPWVDIEKLIKSLSLYKTNTSLTNPQDIADFKAIHSAIVCVNIYINWKNRQTGN